MMIRVPRCDNPNSARYDLDLPSHVIVIQDWHNMTADSMVPGLLYDVTDQVPKRERYSVVIYCNRPIRSYWIHVRAVGTCEFTRAYQVAILRYRGASKTPPSPPPTYNITWVNSPGVVS
ncbi:hypothetical protein J6590_068734 [Homalodisca vitripennis]|nr:hypothetical protein J6590_068734 [Homalodisca vitripennis]